MPFGDKPNFPLPSQRLDKVDVEAISELAQESMLRLFGSIMGPSYGLLSDVAFTWDYTAGPTGDLTIGKCRLGYVYYDPGSDADNQYGTDGGVVRHDPDLGVASNVLSLTTGVLGWIFFKPTHEPVDEENRAYWNGLSMEKKVGLAMTRVRESATFAFATSLAGAYLPADGWYPFLRLGAWDTTTPAFTKIHFLEGFHYTGQDNGLLFQHGDTAPAVSTPTSLDEAYASFGVKGLSHLMRGILSQMCLIMDTGWTFVSDNLVTPGTVGWRGTPSRGLTQINEVLDVVAPKPAVHLVLEVRWNDAAAYALRVIYDSGEVSKSVATESLGGAYKGAVILLIANAGYAIYDVTAHAVSVDALPGGFEAVHATVNYDVGDLPAAEAVPFYVHTYILEGSGGAFIPVTPTSLQPWIVTVYAGAV